MSSAIQFHYDPFVEFERFFDDAFDSRFWPSTASVEAGRRPRVQQRPVDFFRPRLDLHESQDSNMVTATIELPGLTPEDVTIDIHQNRLTVSGEASSSEHREEGGYAIRERRRGKFSRTLQLPFGTKPEDVKAKIENGLLTLTFPKATPEQQSHRIPIQ